MTESPWVESNLSRNQKPRLPTKNLGSCFRNGSTSTINSNSSDKSDSDSIITSKRQRNGKRKRKSNRKRESNRNTTNNMIKNTMTIRIVIVTMTIIP